MSIKERQMTRANAEVISQQLVAGQFPDLSFVQDKVTKMFARRPAGLPRFELASITAKEVSDAGKYNGMMRTLQDDLSVSYEELMYQTDRMMALADYYDTEKNKVQLELKSLSRRVEVLNERLKSRGRRQVLFDTFNDFTKVDFEGNPQIILEPTDAFVDLRHGYVTLPEIYKATDKLSLADSYGQVKNVTKFDSFEALAPIENIFSDYINAGWRYKAVLIEPEEAAINVNIELTNAANINVISLMPQSPRPMLITVKTSADGNVWKAELEREVGAFMEWHIGKTDVKYIQLSIRKVAPDVVLGTEYQYYFGIQNLSLRSVRYMPKGKVVSTPYHPSRSYNSMTLEVDEYVPPDTEIKYYVSEMNRQAEYQCGATPRWKPITPGKPVQFNHMTSVETSLPITNDASYGALYQHSQGHDYYTMGTVPELTDNGTIKLGLGRDQFQVDSITLPLEPTFIPTLSTWKNVTPERTSFMDVNKAYTPLVLTMTAGECIRFTTYLYFDEDVLVDSIGLQVANVNASVYLNNVQIKNIVSGFTYNFKRGVNKLEVYAFAYDNGSIATNVNLPDILSRPGAIECRAVDALLTQVSVHDLLNNTSKRDINKFAIVGDGQLVTNYNPLTMARNNGQVKYTLSFQYPDDMPLYQTHIRFMAMLVQNGGHDDLTPILKSYKLILE